MSKLWVPTRLTVPSVVLQHDRQYRCHNHQGHVLEDSPLHELQKVWPRWIVLEAAQREKPPLSLFVLPQDSLLILERIAEILEHENQEGGDDESFVETADRLVVDRLADVDKREPGRYGIDGDHKEHPHNVSLLVWLQNAENKVDRGKNQCQ